MKNTRLITRLYMALVTVAIVTSCASSAVQVREPPQATRVLHRFVRIEEGKYGYDYNRPIPYHRFTDQSVMIPETLIPQKHKFRAAWVATVFDINFRTPRTPEEFKAQYIEILDVFDEWKMNAVIFQVSPLLDSFWPSQHRPWSQHASGTQGVDPGWDPLEWIIAETHRRGMAFHAWLNPYRVTASRHRFFRLPNRTSEELAAMNAQELIAALNEGGLLADNNFAVQNPQLVYLFNETLWLDAGRPEVRRHVADTVREIVERYDVCAIHFDDYFYPYPVPGLVFGDADEDRATFLAYGLGHFPDSREGIQAWRRHNNDELIRKVRAVINGENQRNNRAIRFGISPFGIWEHRDNHPLGSFTPLGSGSTFSNQVFSDTFTWVREEMIDYIVPQIYWSFDQGAAPYAELARWWASVAEGVNVHLYIGHANYKHITNSGWEAAWKNPYEILHQLKYNQLHPAINGSVFFSFSNITPFQETAPRYVVANQASRLLRDWYQTHHTLIPPLPWLMDTPPTPVLEVHRPQPNIITWTDTEDSTARYYVVYRIPTTVRARDLNRAIADPRHIVTRVWRDGLTHTFTDNSVENPERYNYFVTAVNAAHMESAPRQARR